MTERRPQDAAHTGGERADPSVPKDLPDQQIQEGEDPLDVPVPQRVRNQLEESGDASKDVPDTDESGARRAGEEHTDAAEEHLTTEESTG